VKSYFPGLSNEQLHALGAYHTATEISGQPQLWLKTWLYLYNVRRELKDFLLPLYEKDHLQIILTGAGTSAYVGDVLQGVFLKDRKVQARSVATTDIVTHPGHYFHPQQTTLLISFARSGNSPESIKAVQLANEVCSRIFHLVITCNADGALAKEVKGTNSFVFTLPPESNDLSLAMTGSFTSMLLSGLLIARLEELADLKDEVRRLADYGTKILQSYFPVLHEAAQLDFDRAVFLGSGIFQGIARESHLKLQELTDGQVICKFDTFLGFRHGPKAVITPHTLMVYLFSNRDYVQQYERDLVEAVVNGQKGILGIGIMEHAISGVHLDSHIILSDDGVRLDESLLTPAMVLPAQMIAFLKSIHLGLEPDNPSRSGTITRVVQGVKLYPFSKESVNE